MSERVRRSVERPVKLHGVNPILPQQTESIGADIPLVGLVRIERGRLSCSQ